MPPLNVMGKETSFVLVSMTINSQLIMRAFDGFCDNLSPVTPPTHTHTRDSSARKVLKGVLKNCDKDGKVYLFTVDDFWQRFGEGLLSLMDGPLGV